ncbi:MAG: hypothetical protein Q7T55_16915 [Solirubrobacteraceae bacterium]|nr:hypothetical protein [Solirubrobacteraceae bacterium]
MRRAPVLLLLATVALILGVASPALAADAVEGKPFTGVVATFTGNAVPKQVTIDWGDGTAKQTTAVATQPDKSGTVTGVHTFAKLGSYSVTITDAANPDVSERVTFNVTDAPVTAQGTTFKTAAAGGGVVVATIADENPLGTPADFKVTIDWGDGAAPTDGILAPVAGSPGRYTVSGIHPYPDGASYLAGITIKSADFGAVNLVVQSTADGLPESAPAVPAGKVLDFGRGDEPSLAVEENGTADLVWSTPPAAGTRTGDNVIFCKLPRGARACSVKRTFVVDALTPPRILRDRDGVLRIVVSYNGPAQIGGGTLVISSKDDGQSWDYAFFRVNTGLFQGSIVDAALSADGRVLYALFGDYVPGDKAQVFAAIGLDRPILDRLENPGRVGGVDTYSARGVGVLEDGRVVLAGFDTSADVLTDAKKAPRAALRVVAGPDGAAIDGPWTPIRGGAVFGLASTLRGAALIGSSRCKTGIEVSSLRGLTLGAPRPLGADGVQSCGVHQTENLSFDLAGGRHAVWSSEYDGCQGKGPHETAKQHCIIYRRARPGGDFGPKTAIASSGIGPAQGLVVGAGRDGQGWIAWRSLGADGVATVKVTPTDVSSEEAVGPDHRIAITFKPSAECSKTGSVTLGVQSVGPTKGKPTISSVEWSTTKGLTPRHKTDRTAPYSTGFSVDKREFRGLSSTGVIVFTMTVDAKVKFRVGGGKSQTAKLQQPVSFYCGVPFSKVKKK